MNTTYKVSKNYHKEIAENNFYYARSCIRQNFFPGSEVTFLKILKDDLNKTIYDDPHHTTCTGIGYHSDVVPFDTIQTVVARHFALMTAQGITNFVASCVTSFGMYIEITETWKHYPEQLEKIRTFLKKATGSFVEFLALGGYTVLGTLKLNLEVLEELVALEFGISLMHYIDSQSSLLKHLVLCGSILLERLSIVGVHLNLRKRVGCSSYGLHLLVGTGSVVMSTCIGCTKLNFFLSVSIFLCTCSYILDEVDATLILVLHLRPSGLNFLFLGN